MARKEKWQRLTGYTTQTGIAYTVYGKQRGNRQLHIQSNGEKRLTQYDGVLLRREIHRTRRGMVIHTWFSSFKK